MKIPQQTALKWISNLLFLKENVGNFLSGTIRNLIASNCVFIFNLLISLALKLKTHLTFLTIKNKKTVYCGCFRNLLESF
jgi:hypothetical protein